MAARGGEGCVGSPTLISGSDQGSMGFAGSKQLQFRPFRELYPSGYSHPVAGNGHGQGQSTRLWRASAHAEGGVASRPDQLNFIQYILTQPHQLSLVLSVFH